MRDAAQDHGPCQRVGDDPSSAPRGASANSGNPLKGSGRVPPAAIDQERLRWIETFCDCDMLWDEYERRGGTRNR